jgi:hypothetical protein
MKIRIRKSSEIDVWIISYPNLLEDWCLTFEVARTKGWEYIRKHSGKKLGR